MNLPLNLPQCFLADLLPEAELTPSLIMEAWLALQRNREQYLTPLNTDSVIGILAEASGLWLEPASLFMDAALELGSAQLGFSRLTLRKGLEQLFGSLTLPHLEAWIEQDLGHPRRLDEFCTSPPERASRRRSKAVGPPALAHITAGNIPASSVLSITAGLLVRSSQFVKCGTGTSLIPLLFAHSLHQVNPHVGACLEIVEWPRARNDLLTALVDSADCVTSTGTNEAVAALRQLVPVAKRFVGHGHRVSFAYVAKAALAESSLSKLLAGVAEDVCSWNQLGCLSPHVIYVEAGGAVNVEDFAARLAMALGNLERDMPRGPISQREAATIRSRRSFYEIRAAHSDETLLWQSTGSTAWTVVFETDPLFQTSCLNRFVYVKPVRNLEDALRGADQVRGQVSTVALSAPAADTAQLVNRLATWGVHRICPVGSMQQPPILWRHDGRPVLADLVGWTDLEEN